MVAFRYKAFISYSHADEGWARWVQRALEQMRISRKLAAEQELPRRPLFPVFRDEDELASSSDLSSGIQDALNESANLVIICSPAAAASQWVNAEIEYFQSLGRGERIFCVIVDGDPGSSDYDCFPPQIGWGELKEPLAADLRIAKTRHLAKLKLVAGLLDLRLDELRQRDAEKRRRDWLIRGAGGIAAGVLVAMLAVRVTATPPCLGSEARLAGIWDDQARVDTHAAFLAVDLPFNQSSVTRTMTTLDRYAGEWVSAHRDACEATHVREEQSEALLDMRMGCLEERRLELAAITDVLREADAVVVEQAVKITNDLGSLARCADREALMAAFPLPEDPITRAKVNQLRTRIAPLKAKVEFGEGEKIVSEIKSIVIEAQTTEYPPVTAEVLALLGEAQLAAGLTEEAEDTFHQGAAAAARAGDDRLLIHIWLQIIALQVDYRGELREAERLLALVDAALSRLSGAAELEASVESTRGHVFLRSGRAEEARHMFAKALDIAEESALANRELYAMNLVSALTDLRMLDEAEVLLSEVHQRTLDGFGADHPRTAGTLWSMARIAQRRADYHQSKELSLRSIGIFERAYGATHPLLASLNQGLAWDLKNLGEFEAAHAALDRSAAISTIHPEDVEFFVRAAIYNTRGDLFVSQGLDTNAREAFQNAIALWEEELPGHPGVSGSITNLGMLENREGRHNLALQTCTRALAMDEVSWGDTSPELGWSLGCIGDAQYNLGELEAAADALDRGLGVLDAPGADRHLTAEVKFLLARIKWDRGEREISVSLAREAHEGLRNADPSFNFRKAQVDIWLRAR